LLFSKVVDGGLLTAASVIGA